MVLPCWRSNLSRAGALGLALVVGGCATVPQERLDDCRRLTQALEAEKSRLKDKNLSLQSQYEDLAQRADDDARRLRVQDEENRRLLASIQSYQSDISDMASELGNLKNQIQLAVNPVSTALLDDLDGFAKGHPGCRFDRSEKVITVSSDVLFEPGTARLKPEARTLLVSLAGVFERPEGRSTRMIVSGHTETSPVQPASLAAGRAPAKSQHLSLDRAVCVRDLLAFEAKLDPTTIEAAGFEASRPAVDGAGDNAQSQNRRIEIRLLGATESKPPAGPPATRTSP